MSASIDDSLLEQTRNGPVYGFVDTHELASHSSAGKPPGGRKAVRKWLGIPYARAGRWERPQSPVPWQEPRACLEFGPCFPQLGSPFDMLYKDVPGWLDRSFLGQSEDAFTVNVFAPAASEEKNLPVMVWLYGGNFNSGSSNSLIYDPTEFVRRQTAAGRPCIVVTGNYRVGIFGWLATADLMEVNGHVGNFGLHDTLMIFDWVQENISNFGGDPSNVTAFGESAGAFLLAALLNSGRKHFKRAILQSGNHSVMAQRQGPFFPGYETLLEALEISKDVPAQVRIDRLKQASWPDLLKATTAVFFPGVWGLTRDPREPGWSSSLWTKIEKAEYDPWIESILLSINKDEGTFFSAGGKFWSEEGLINSLKSRGMYSPEMYTAFKRLYPPEALSPDKSNLASLGCTQYLHDQALLTPLQQMASSLAGKPGSESGRTIETFVCQFETIPESLLKKYPFMGILHTGEIPFVFNTATLWDYDDASEDARTAQWVGDAWAKFATTGQPGWPGYSPSRGQAICIETGGRTRAVDFNEMGKERCDFWSPLLREQARVLDSEVRS